MECLGVNIKEKKKKDYVTVADIQNMGQSVFTMLHCTGVWISERQAER